MTSQTPSLEGRHVRLEPLDLHHIDALAAAAVVDPSLYEWSLVPQGNAAMAAYVHTALAWRDAGTAVTFAIIRRTDSAVIGSTRFFNITYWSWPPDHPWHGRVRPDVCEIGYTWFTRSAIRTAANTESKLLMLAYAFEAWQVHRVSFHTDKRNERSRAALERIGAQLEGVLRSHRMAADYTPRDSLRFSIIASEWPAVKQRLLTMLQASA